jgi:two-component system, LytTR family, sensor kinase
MPTSTRTSSSIWLFKIGVPAGWIFFTLLVMGITWAGYAMQGRKTAVGSLFIQYLGLFLWSGVTFLVVFLARRWPLGRKNLIGTACLHAGFGLVIVAGHVGLEYSLGHALGARTLYSGLFGYKAYIYFLIYWLIVGATTAYDNHARYRESQLLTSQLEAQLAQSQLRALKMQLHPHFLFNAHHAIVALMLDGEIDAAIKMLTRLSDLLRLTLDKSDQQVISLRDELSALDLYLGIQKERYRERMQVEVEVAPDTLAGEVPYLLLQPVVENAFKHGIDTLSEGGVLRIKAHRHADSLCLSVWDNGPGFVAPAPGRSEEHVGLGNTRARLQGLYGDNYRLDILSRSGMGTEVQILLPYKIFGHRLDEPARAPA